MKRRLAYIAVAFAACGAVVAMPPGGPHRKGEAAIAIRDRVPGYQQVFTERYTVPRLEAAYEQAWYFTETPAVSRRNELYAALDEATRRYEHVDLFLLAHGNRYIDVVRRLPPAQRAKLRLVYDTGGGSARQGEEWKTLGVGTFVGHPGGNIAPVFYLSFLPEWVRSQDAEKAQKAGDEAVHELLFGPVGNVANRWMDRDGLWAGTQSQRF